MPRGSSCGVARHVSADLRQVRAGPGDRRVRGQLDEAVRAYRQGLQIDANQPQILYNLSVILRRQGRLEEARGTIDHPAWQGPWCDHVSAGRRQIQHLEVNAGK